ncbi:hypothetical protein M413DRAFT_122496 [Hebeloma cylindrosporum]|uniref:Uncharacterized protein n=1 Tax=Hebeloma cylindrosporum TaxID=76867 RepID=A0A0C3C1H6_HEBCY|nr:hypothetical protein M413DRAFT_122496 [Hebeloma cylindrosporum h7]
MTGMGLATQLVRKIRLYVSSRRLQIAVSKRKKGLTHRAMIMGKWIGDGLVSLMESLTTYETQYRPEFLDSVDLHPSGKYFLTFEMKKLVRRQGIAASHRRYQN